MPSHHVDDGCRHKKWSDAARTALRKLNLGIFNQWQTTDARANHTGYACGQLVGPGLTRRQACVLDGLLSGSDTVMDEGVHGARIFGAHVLLHVEAFDLTGNLAGEGLRIELGDAVNTGLAGQNIGPGIGHRVPHGTDATQAGHDNATTAHAFNLYLSL